MGEAHVLVYLRPFVHQAGGHTCVLELSKSLICKPYQEREVWFYKTEPDTFKEFTPKFVGEIDVICDMTSKDRQLMAYVPVSVAMGSKNIQKVTIGSESPDHGRSDETSLNSKKGLELWSVQCIDRQINRYGFWANNCPEKFIILENLVSKYSLPCMLDLKMGTRQYGEDSSSDKRKLLADRCANSTSATLGFRICGTQVYKSDTKSYVCQDKYYGRDLDDTGVKAELQQFFHNGVHLRKDALLSILQKLQRLCNLLKSQDTFLFFSCSLLLMYDGDQSSCSTNQPPSCSSNQPAPGSLHQPPSCPVNQLAPCSLNQPPSSSASQSAPCCLNQPPSCSTNQSAPHTVTDRSCQLHSACDDRFHFSGYRDSEPNNSTKEDSIMHSSPLHAQVPAESTEKGNSYRGDLKAKTNEVMPNLPSDKLNRSQGNHVVSSEILPGCQGDSPFHISSDSSNKMGTHAPFSISVAKTCRTPSDQDVIPIKKRKKGDCCSLPKDESFAQTEDEVQCNSETVSKIFASSRMGGKSSHFGKCLDGEESPCQLTKVDVRLIDFAHASLKCDVPVDNLGMDEGIIYGLECLISILNDLAK